MGSTTIKRLYLDDLLKEKDPEVVMEMATVCSISRHQLGIIIDLRTDDYGQYETKNFIENKDLPAHAHVSNSSNVELGYLNITGPCPKTINDIHEYVRKNDQSTSKFTRQIKEKIVIWANMQREVASDNPVSNWTNAQLLWQNFQDTRKK